MPVSFADIHAGSAYTRNDLAKLWGYASPEALSRGVVTPRDDNKFILFVTRDKRPDVEQYEDELIGDVLLWEGPNDHFAEDRMVNHRQAGDEVHLFYREQNRSEFTYIGQLVLHCCQRFTDRPSRFVFRVRRGTAEQAAPK
jgi:hypothetical protein